LSLKKILIILLFALIGWVICAAIMGIGMSILSLETTLIIHLIGGPLAFAILSAIYHKWFNYTKPLITAIIFVSFVIIIDFFLVALVINKSLDMFKSIIGTWIPFLLIFITVYLTGILINKNK
jgi:hypothetical protein